MGRYYNTDTGREGKFMFGVQPSDDPQYMGMGENPSYIQYYASDEDEPEVRKKLDEQYDILGVDKEKRVYYMKDWNEFDKFEKEVLDDKVWIKVKRNDKETLDKYKGQTTWAGDNDDEVMFERKNMALVLARIRLGVVILSDIKDQGYCQLEAET